MEVSVPGNIRRRISGSMVYKRDRSDYVRPVIKRRGVENHVTKDLRAFRRMVLTS